MSASSRALSRPSSLRASATVRAIVFHAPGPSNQNRAMSVWSGVRTVLTLPPTVFTSLKSRAYVALVNAGGPGSQYCAAESKVNGVTLTQLGWAEGANPRAASGFAIGGFAGDGLGCGRHRPGPIAGVYGASRVAPSSFRRVSMAAPAARPTATPAFRAGASVTRAIDAAYACSTSAYAVPFCAGVPKPAMTPTSTVCAAAAAAASGEAPAAAGPSK